MHHQCTSCQAIPQSPPPEDKKGVKVDGRAAANIPKIRSPPSNHREDLIFMDRQKKASSNSTALKFAETTPAVAPTRVLLSQGGGGGGMSNGCRIRIHPRDTGIWS